MGHCIICNHHPTEVLRAGQPGYVEGTRFDIVACGQCNTRFISPIVVPATLYDLIYSGAATPGYDRYFEFANTVKSQKDALAYLAGRESTYFAVAHALKDKPPLTILEIGCGYGYLTYALNRAGHRAVGIDLSTKAIDHARKNFGDCYHSETIETFARKNTIKFDAVVFTEVIEHLSDPVSFVRSCQDLLQPGGMLVLTTPGRDYFDERSVWHTDLPPVHTAWFSKKSFEVIAARLDLNLKFIDFRHWSSRNVNRLLHYFLTRKEPAPAPTLNADGLPKSVSNEAANGGSFLKRVSKFLLVDFVPVVKISNFLYYTLKLNRGYFPQLGVILTKKPE